MIIDHFHADSSLILSTFETGVLGIWAQINLSAGRKFRMPGGPARWAWTSLVAQWHGIMARIYIMISIINESFNRLTFLVWIHSLYKLP